MTTLDASTMPHRLAPSDPVSWLASADMADEAGDEGWAERLRKVGRMAMLDGPVREKASLAFSSAVAKVLGNGGFRCQVHLAGTGLDIVAIQEWRRHVRVGLGVRLVTKGCVVEPLPGGFVPLPPGFAWGIIVSDSEDPVIYCRLGELPKFMA